MNCAAEAVIADERPACEPAARPSERTWPRGGAECGQAAGRGSPSAAWRSRGLSARAVRRMSGLRLAARAVGRGLRCLAGPWVPGLCTGGGGGGGGGGGWGVFGGVGMGLAMGQLAAWASVPNGGAWVVPGPEWARASAAILPA